jgi:hypothetical protein
VLTTARHPTSDKLSALLDDDHNLAGAPTEGVAAAIFDQFGDDEARPPATNGLQINRLGLIEAYPDARHLALGRGANGAAQPADAVRQIVYGVSLARRLQGGHSGLVKAVQEANRTRDIMIVCHESNELTVPLLRNSQLDFLIAQDPAALLSVAVRQAASEDPQAQELVDFYVHTISNVPSYAR